MLCQIREAIKTAIGALMMSLNIVLESSIGRYFTPSTLTNQLLHTSLSVEGHSYLIFLAWRLSCGLLRELSLVACIEGP